jgi:hypothetical protein
MPTDVILTIRLSQEIFDKYSEQAATTKKNVDSLIAERLGKAVKMSASKPIIFNDEQRRTLEGLLGKNFKDAEDILQHINRVLTIKLNGCEIPIKATTLTRLKSRCFGLPFDQFLTQTVQNELERAVGLRG